MSESYTPKTFLESAIERRNAYQGRLAERMCDVVYWTAIMKKSKKNSPDAVDAFNEIAKNQQKVVQDTLLVQCWDKIVEAATNEQPDIEFSQIKKTLDQALKAK